MTNVRTGWLALAALWFIAPPACGGTTSGNSTASAAGGTGGVPPTGGYSTGGHSLPSGGYSTGGHSMPTGGYSTGGYSTSSGGYSTGGHSMPSGGYSTGGTATGGTFSEQPPNGATCLCLLAESLHMPGGWPQAACTSVNPNDCTLQKAYCGQSCAGDANCGVTCIAGFSEHAFDDAATYSYGSCAVIIRCPAPSS
jgi:hypothetical protein